MKKRLMNGMIGAVVALVVLAGSARSVWAGAVITSGPVTLGIGTLGNLGDGTFGGTGLSLAGVGDAIAPGCFCEGWGVAGNGKSGYADIAVDGFVNLTGDSFGSTATTATSMVHLTSLPDLQVTQAYAPSAGAPTALFEDTVTIKNASGTTSLTDVRYRRVMDWDIPPTVFHEFVTIAGLPATNIIFTNDDGFDTANPLSVPTSPGGDLFGCGTSVNFTDCGPSDHGAHFDFKFDDLNPGDSKTFSIFYGAAYSEAAALAALGSVGAEGLSLGQFSGDPTGGTPGTYIFGFKGVGGTPIGTTPVIPEPGTLSLLTLGFAGIGFGARKRLF